MIPATGDITGMTVPWLFQDLRRGKSTGTVVFTRGDEVKKVFFKNGDILFAASNLKDDRLGEFMVRTGKITAAQFDKASEVVVRSGKKLGAVLFEMEALTAHDLVAQVKLHIKEIILRLFTWRDGRYQFDNGPLPLTEIIPLHMSTGEVIMEGVRGLEWKDIRKSLPSLNTILRPAADPLLLFQRVHLDRDQQEVFSFIDGSKSIKETCFLSDLGEYNTLKAIYVLLALRMAESGEVKAEDGKFMREAVPKADAPEALKEKEPERAAPDASATREMVKRAYESLDRQNCYEALGVSRDSATQEVRKAYLHVAKLYHPDRHFDPGMDDMKEKLDAIFSRMHDAYETLISPEKRRQYDAGLVSGKSVNRAEADSAGTGRPDKKTTALMQYNEGMTQFNRGNFWGADEAFEWAMRLDPDNAEYVFQRGRTLSHIPQRGHDAEEYFARAIAMAPSKTDYYLELGNFYAKSGLKKKALAVLQDALRHDPHSEKVRDSISKIGT